MIKIALKFTLGFCLVYYLIHTKTLDAKSFTLLFQNPELLFIALGLHFIATSLSSLRWKYLLESQWSKPLSFSRVFSINWIGLFFSSVLPGAISGDIIKFFYIKKLIPSMDKFHLSLTILLDRIMGLIALSFIGALASLAYFYQYLENSTSIQMVLFFNMALAMGSGLFFLSIFLPLKAQELILCVLQRIPYLGSFLIKLLNHYWSLGKSKAIIIKSFLLSLVIQMICLFIFYYLAIPLLKSPLSFLEVLVFVPPGILSIVIPLTPGGMGIGHAFFASLFSLIGHDNGADLFNTYFIVLMINNLLGFIPYLLSPKPKKSL